VVQNHAGGTGFRGRQPRDRTGPAAMPTRGSGRSEGMSVEGGRDTRASPGRAGRKVCTAHSPREWWAREGRSVETNPTRGGREIRPGRQVSTLQGSQGQRVRSWLSSFGTGIEARHRRKTSEASRETGKVKEGAGKTNDPLRRPRGRRISHLTMTGPRQALGSGEPHESLCRAGAAQVASVRRKACRPSILWRDVTSVPSPCSTRFTARRAGP